MLCQSVRRFPQRTLFIAGCLAALPFILPVQSAQANDIDSDTVISTLINGAVIGKVNTEPFTVDFVDGGAVNGSTDIYHQAAVNFTGQSAAYGGHIRARDQAALTVRDQADVSGAAFLYNNATLRVSGQGKVGGVLLYDATAADVSGNAVVGNLEVNGTSRIDFSGATAAQDGLTANDYARLSFTDQASISGGYVNLYDHASLSLSGSASTLLAVYGNEYSTVSLSGNAYVSSLYIFDFNVTTITGGTIANDFTVSYGAVATVSGGSFQDVFLYGSDSVVSFIGSDLALTETGGGTRGGTAYTSYLLTGTLQDGTVLNNAIEVDNGSKVRLLSGAAVPEAGSAALLGAAALLPLASLALRRRRSVPSS